MSIKQTYLFNAPTGFNVSNVLIGGSGAKLALINKPGETFSQVFTSSAGFTYNPAKAEFIGSALRQKLQSLVPPSFSNLAGVTVTGSSVQKTAVGNTFDAGLRSVETIVSGNGYVEFTAHQNNADILAGLATSQPDHGITNINFAVYLQSTGIFGVYELGSNIGDKGSYSANDIFRVEVVGTSVVYKRNGTIFYTSLTAPTFPLFFSTSFGTSLGQLDLITFLNSSPYAASEVDLPVFTDPDLGVIESLSSFTTTESGVPRYTIDGKYWNGTAWVSSNSSYAQASSASIINTNIASLVVTGEVSIPVKIFFQDDTVQSSITLLTLGFVGQKYATSGWCEPSMAIQAKDLLAYSDMRTIDAGIDDIKIVVKSDGLFTYWNGTAWVSSDGSFAQSNTPAELAAHLPTLVLGSNSSIFLRWNFSTTSPILTAVLTEADITFDFGAVAVDPPVCLTYGYVRDLTGAPEVGVKVSFSLVAKNNLYEEATSNVIIGEIINVLTDANGYFETNLIYSSALAPSSIYMVSFSKGAIIVSKNAAGAITFSVPDADMQNITDLLT